MTRRVVGYLLDLGGGALEELDVARADALAVLGQRLVGRVVAGEQHERVAGRAAVGLVHEQYAVLAVEHVHRRQTLLEELQLRASVPACATDNTSVLYLGRIRSTVSGFGSIIKPVSDSAKKSIRFTNVKPVSL